MDISLPIKPAREKPECERKRCANCGKLFMQNKHWQRFCNPKCRYEWDRNDSAFGRLKEKLTAHWEKEFARMKRELERQFVKREELLGDEGVEVVRSAVRRRRARSASA